MILITFIATSFSGFSGLAEKSKSIKSGCQKEDKVHKYKAKIFLGAVENLSKYPLIN